MLLEEETSKRVKEVNQKRVEEVINLVERRIEEGSNKFLEELVVQLEQGKE
jgi:hypothetical protein